jgi:NAD(P)-dependent dehydrogenase (short-subunit alcohol dehydrogenase family)
MTAIALITGASGGIGRALALQLHAAGYRVAAVGRAADRLADVEAAVRIGADTTTPEGAALALTACQEALGAAPTLLAHCVSSTLIDGAARLTGQVIAVDGGFTSVRPLVK